MPLPHYWNRGGASGSWMTESHECKSHEVSFEQSSPVMGQGGRTSPHSESPLHPQVGEGKQLTHTAHTHRTRSHGERVCERIVERIVERFSERLAERYAQPACAPTGQSDGADFVATSKNSPQDGTCGEDAVAMTR